MKPQTHKEELHQRNHLGTVSRKTTGWSLNQFYSRETSPLDLTQFKINPVLNLVLYVFCRILSLLTIMHFSCFVPSNTRFKLI